MSGHPSSTATTPPMDSPLPTDGVGVLSPLSQLSGATPLNSLPLLENPSEDEYEPSSDNESEDPKHQFVRMPWHVNCHPDIKSRVDTFTNSVRTGDEDPDNAYSWMVIIDFQEVEGTQSIFLTQLRGSATSLGFATFHIDGFKMLNRSRDDFHGFNVFNEPSDRYNYENFISAAVGEYADQPGGTRQNILKLCGIFNTGTDGDMNEVRNLFEMYKLAHLHVPDRYRMRFEGADVDTLHTLTQFLNFRDARINQTAIIDNRDKSSYMLITSYSDRDTDQWTNLKTAVIADPLYIDNGDFAISDLTAAEFKSVMCDRLPFKIAAINSVDVHFLTPSAWNRYKSSLPPEGEILTKTLTHADNLSPKQKDQAAPKQKDKAAPKPKKPKKNAVTTKQNVEGTVWKFPWKYNIETRFLGKVRNEKYLALRNRIIASGDNIERLRHVIDFHFISKNTLLLFVKKGNRDVIEELQSPQSVYNVLRNCNIIWDELDIDLIDDQIDFEALMSKEIEIVDYWALLALVKCDMIQEARETLRRFAEVMSIDELYTNAYPKEWRASGDIMEVWDNDPTNGTVVACNYLSMLDMVLCANGILHKRDNDRVYGYLMIGEGDKIYFDFIVGPTDKQRFQSTFQDYEFGSFAFAMLPSHVRKKTQSLLEYTNTRAPEGVDDLYNDISVLIVTQEEWNQYMNTLDATDDRAKNKKGDKGDDSDDNPDDNPDEPVDVLPKGSQPKYVYGTKNEVWARVALITPGGLQRKDLGKNEHCKVVSLKASESAQDRYDEPKRTDRARRKFEQWNDKIKGQYFPDASKRARYDPDAGKAQHYAPKRYFGSWERQMEDRPIDDWGDKSDGESDGGGSHWRPVDIDYGL